jgi:hypothetical protein
MAGDDGRASTDELERFRRAAEDALQQLDWCTGYLHGLHKPSEAGVLARATAPLSVGSCCTRRRRRRPSRRSPSGGE